jgi:hypothetical protein
MQLQQALRANDLNLLQRRKALIKAAISSGRSSFEVLNFPASPLGPSKGHSKNLRQIGSDSGVKPYRSYRTNVFVLNSPCYLCKHSGLSLKRLLSSLGLAERMNGKIRIR